MNPIFKDFHTWYNQNEIPIVILSVVAIILIIAIARSLSKKKQAVPKQRKTLLPSTYMVNTKLLEHLEEAIENNKERSFGVILSDYGFITYRVNEAGRKVPIDPRTMTAHDVLKVVEGTNFDRRNSN